MLTRIEIDGFKTFEDFKLDVTPFMVVLGPNAAGKSNLFDVVHLLSRLASTDLRTAFTGLRGEPWELFRRDAKGEPGKRMRLAVEVLLPPEAKDPFGDIVTVKHSRARYEVTIERRTIRRGIERLYVVSESARPIARKDDGWRPGGAAPSAAFRTSFLRYGRPRTWLETVRGGEGGSASARFELHQEDKQGRPRSHAAPGEATVLSSVTSRAEFPHIYALREELRSWRLLQLDPRGIRHASPTDAPDELLPDASNLAAVLFRIRAETRSRERPEGVLADIGAQLSSLIPDVTRVSVDLDKHNREYRASVHMGKLPPFSTRVVSDGTLRVLALLSLLHDPRTRGLVCFEEPENGVHPLRLSDLVDRLRGLSVDAHGDAVDASAPLTQVLMNSHSPVVLGALSKRPGEAVFADVTRIVDSKSAESRPRTRMRPILAQDQGEIFADEARKHVTRFEVNRVLASVAGGA